MRYWKRLNPDETIRTVESYSHDFDVDGAIEITEDEFNDFIAGLPAPIYKPPRDIIKEFDTLKAELKGKGVIS